MKRKETHGGSARAIPFNVFLSLSLASFPLCVGILRVFGHTYADGSRAPLVFLHTHTHSESTSGKKGTGRTAQRRNTHTLLVKWPSFLSTLAPPHRRFLNATIPQKRIYTFKKKRLPCAVGVSISFRSIGIYMRIRRAYVHISSICKLSQERKKKKVQWHEWMFLSLWLTGGGGGSNGCPRLLKDLKPLDLRTGTIGLAASCCCCCRFGRLLLYRFCVGTRHQQQQQQHARTNSRRRV